MESSKCYTLNSSLNRYSFPFLIFTSLFKKRQQMNNVITTKKLILSKYFRKISLFVFASAILSIPLLLSPIPKAIEAQKAESEIEAEMCITYNKSEKLISITCNYADFEDVTRVITDREILNSETSDLSNSDSDNNNNEKVWLLNAGLKVEENALLNINSNDVTWLKIIPTNKSPNAIEVYGSLKVDVCRSNNFYIFLNYFFYYHSQITFTPILNKKIYLMINGL